MSTQPDYTLYERIYTLVAQIPAGAVASYGDIAHMVGGGCDARTVGYALGAMGDRPLPWQRVIAQDGSISTRGSEQRRLLEAEGIRFDSRGRVIMTRQRWVGPDVEWAATHHYQPLPPRDDDAEQLELF